jgi:hypothetical protein
VIPLFPPIRIRTIRTIRSHAFSAAPSVFICFDVTTGVKVPEITDM